MKKKEIQAQLEKVVDSDGRVDAAMIVEGKRIDPKPILVGMAVGLIYAQALLSDEADDAIVEPKRVIDSGLLAACKSLGYIKGEDDGKEE